LIKTSTSHPIRIDHIDAGPALGRIGMTFCPGKKDLLSLSGPWDRDLATDLDAIRDWGAAAVVTLIERHEFDLLQVNELGEGVVARQMKWFHLPIRDVSIPDNTFETEWISAGEALQNLLHNGEDIVVHCRGGFGRAGTIAAKLMIELGHGSDKAIKAVRSTRPGTIETFEQEQYARSAQ